MVVLVSAASAMPLLAGAEGGYVGVSLGQSRYHYTTATGYKVVSKLNEELTQRSGITTYSDYTIPTYSDLNATNTAYKLYGGYAFTKNWALEAGYTDFSTIETTVYDRGAIFTVEMPSRALYAAAKGMLPLNDSFSLFAKLGVTKVHSGEGRMGITQNMPRAFFSGSDNTNVLIGVGTTYSLSKNMALNLEYENYGKMDNPITPGKISMFSISTHYTF